MRTYGITLGEYGSEFGATTRDKSTGNHPTASTKKRLRRRLRRRGRRLGQQELLAQLDDARTPDYVELELRQQDEEEYAYLWETLLS